MHRSLSLTCAFALFGFSLPGCATYKRWAYEGWGRDTSQKPAEVIQALHLKPGMSVADLGAGGGYFTFRLADAVGGSGHVYAVDVDEDMVEYVRTRAREEGHANVSVVLAAYDDPELPDASVDLLFTCNTYHHLEDRSAYFAHAARVLKPGGRVAIIDMNGQGWFAWLFGHSTSRDTIASEMNAAGYELAEEQTFLPEQSFLIFARAKQ